jgi:hypothetical protein
MSEEHSNIQEADDLLKLAYKLDPNSTLELEIEWYMKIKQNAGVQKALKVVNSCKPFLLKVLLIMKSVHDDIVTTAKNSESNISANLTTQLSPPINLPIVCENRKATESNTSIDTKNYSTFEHELVETYSKRQSTLSSFTPQTRNTNMAILDHDASCIYTIIPDNLRVNLKEFADPNWDSDIPSTMSAEKILVPYKQNMQTVFKFPKHNLEDMFFKCIRFKIVVIYKRRHF